MNERLRCCALGLLALGLTSIGGFAASAQDIDDDGYVVEERTIIREQRPLPVVQADDDDDEDEVLIVHRDGMQRCADAFRSFNPATGTYVTYDGETRVCPYIE
jgi:hypothetical protein